MMMYVYRRTADQIEGRYLIILLSRFSRTSLWLSARERSGE